MSYMVYADMAYSTVGDITYPFIYTVVTVATVSPTRPGNLSHRCITRGR